MLMELLRKQKILNFIWLFTALHILNFSVDSPDPQPGHIPEDLNYNDMESIIEVVLEQFFEFNNVIAEHDENDTDESGGLSIKKSVEFYCYQKSISFFSALNIKSRYKHGQYIDQYSEQFHPEIVPPPPKV